MFDLIHYIKTITKANRRARELGFRFSTCSGVQAIEGLLTDMRDAERFVCVSDVTQGNTTYNGQAWSARRVLTCFVLSRYELGNGDDYQRALHECRTLYKMMLSRMLHDAPAIADRTEASIRLDDVRSNELGGTFLDGATGLYFVLGVDEPVELVYNDEEWITEEE